MASVPSLMLTTRVAPGGSARMESYGPPRREWAGVYDGPQGSLALHLLHGRSSKSSWEIFMIY